MVYLIIAAVTLAIGVTDEILKTVNKNKLQPVINELTEYATKNQRFLNDLEEAYNEGNSLRLNALLTSSPVGNAYKHLKNEIKTTTASFKDKKKQVEAQIDKANQQLNKANSNLYSNNNSMIIDSADNLSKSTAIVDEAKKITSTDLINGGI